MNKYLKQGGGGGGVTLLHLLILQKFNSFPVKKIYGVKLFSNIVSNIDM